MNTPKRLIGKNAPDYIIDRDAQENHIGVGRERYIYIIGKYIPDNENGRHVQECSIGRRAPIKLSIALAHTIIIYTIRYTLHSQQCLSRISKVQPEVIKCHEMLQAATGFHKVS